MPHGFTDDKEITDLDEYLNGKIEELAEEINKISNDYWKVVYPVGAIYMSTSQTNPAVLFGGGTWVQWGSGRVPVGVSATETEFNTVEKTGGSKAIAAHGHTFNADFFIRDGMSDSGGGPYQNVWGGTNATVSKANGALNFSTAGHSKDNDGHKVKINGNTGTTGTGNSGNLQPYITCYMWKRTA